MSTTTAALQKRNVVRLKALQRASRELDVIPLTSDEERYHVASGSTPGRYYEVTIDPATLQGSCTCAWAEHGGVNCKHVLAVLRARYASEGQISFWRHPQDAARQHRHVIAGDDLYATVRR
jgi:uncharacterized Zn finger protein